jgi:hypothetical protein
LDILLAGSVLGGNKITNVYRNLGNGVFSDIGAGLPGVVNASVIWGDYDNDGRLDILVTGQTATGDLITRLYRSSGGPANTLPSAPGDLSMTRMGSTATFSWSASVDGETPSLGLTYNLRVGLAAGGNQLCTGMADPSSGWRRVVGLGNAQTRLTRTLQLPAGVTTVYWSVQAIDGAYAGSPFAPEQSGGSVAVDEEQLTDPARLALSVAPSPFRFGTTVDYALAERTAVRLAVYDVAGRRVRLLDAGEREAGLRHVPWNGRNDRGERVAAGVYLIRLEAGADKRVGRVMLVH